MSFFDELLKTGAEVVENLPLSHNSSFKIGGNCRYAVFPDSRDRLAAVLRLCNHYGIKRTVIGNASNILFSDSGYDGAIIFTRRMNKITIADHAITVDCGVTLTALAEAMQKNGISGGEFLYGIPGTVGGAVFMNAGAYGGEISDIIRFVECLPSDGSKLLTIPVGECDFSYRNSVFARKPELTVVSCELDRHDGNPDEIRRKMTGYMQSRREKQPLEYPSAGSVFKRPEGHFAGKLIEDAGLKGLRVGGAEVSEKHAGFIVNRGGATAHDVLELVEIIKQKVYENSGITLECEIRTV